jgi:two-component system, OmpR family, sensor kinase
MRRLVPSSLTGRLIATLVLLVVVTSVLVAVLTSVAMRGFLNGQLDAGVRTSLRHLVDDDGRTALPPPGGTDLRSRRDASPPFGDAGTLIAGYVGTATSGSGQVLRGTDRRDLSTAALDRLGDVPADGEVRRVSLPAVGAFRVAAGTRADGTTVVTGTSTRNNDDVLANLVLWEVLLALAAVVMAALAGRYLVHRQLRPLREVAATAHEVADLPLSSGEIGTTVRVPDELTDERTEVGAVGAALNTLLAHVEHALDDRHRSELQVRQFVADASHELRTPLSTIHGYAELTRRTRPMDPEQLSLAMGKVEAEATRMSSLVEDLLLLARLDAGRPLSRDRVDLTKLVLETVGDARVVGPDHRWLLDLADEPVTVPGDEQRLHQVVTNLLNNARRHTPPGTSVRVGAREDGTAAVLTVEDDGPGMSPEMVGNAFERFARGDSSRTRESGGAGLGLSLVQAIAEAHGGTVSVTSQPGRTVFEVRLPAVVEAVVPLHR